MLENNKAIIRKFFELSNKERRTIDELCAPGFKAHIGATPVKDLPSFQKFQADFYKSFTDTYSVIEELIAEGDMVAFRVVSHAKHTGEYAGVPASGKEIVVPVIGMARVVDGKIAEWWNSPDRLSWMQQIGAVHL